MIDLTEFFTPWTVFLGALVIVVITIIVLTIVERKLNKKINIKEEEKRTYFQRNLEAVVAEEDSQRFLFAYERLVRLFFQQKYGANQNSRASQLESRFRTEGNEKAAALIKRIQEINYAGLVLNEKKKQELINDFRSLLSDSPTESAEREPPKEIFLKKDSVGKIKELFGRRRGSGEQEEVSKDFGVLELDNEERPINLKEDKIIVEEMYEEDIGKVRGEILDKIKETAREEEFPPLPAVRIVPFKKEEIHARRRTKRKEGKREASIESIDNLERLKKRLKSGRDFWSLIGVAIE